MTHPIFLLATSFTLVATLTAKSEDWPEFRGPTGQGHSVERGLPVEWGPSKNVAWKQAIPGQGWSSPIVQEGRVYLTSAMIEEATVVLKALCLEAISGAILWNREIIKQDKSRSPGIHSKNTHASATPLIADKTLFIHFGHHGTAALDLNGEILWRNTSLSYTPVHGNGGSPAIVDDLLVFSCDGGSDPFIAALSRKTGEVKWKVRRETDASKTFSFSTPLVIEVEGQKQIISPGSNAVCAYDPRSGAEIWRVGYNGYSVVPRPVYGHGLLFIGTGFDRPTVMAIRPGGKGDVTATHVAWTVTRSAPNTPSLLLVGDELYMVSDGGIASCLDARTGHIHWQERVNGNYSASPVYGDEKIYLQNEQGIGVVLKPGKTFEQLASNPLYERTLASYAIADGALFIRTEGHLYRVQKERGGK